MPPENTDDSQQQPSIQTTQQTSVNSQQSTLPKAPIINNQQNIAPAPPKKSFLNLKIIILLVVITILIASACGFYVFSLKNQTSKEVVKNDQTAIIQSTPTTSNTDTQKLIDLLERSKSLQYISYTEKDTLDQLSQVFQRWYHNQQWKIDGSEVTLIGNPTNTWMLEKKTNKTSNFPGITGGRTNYYKSEIQFTIKPMVVNNSTVKLTNTEESNDHKIYTFTFDYPEENSVKYYRENWEIKILDNGLAIKSHIKSDGNIKDTTKEVSTYSFEPFSDSIFVIPK